MPATRRQESAEWQRPALTTAAACAARCARLALPATILIAATFLSLGGRPEKAGVMDGVGHEDRCASDETALQFPELQIVETRVEILEIETAPVATYVAPAHEVTRAQTALAPTAELLAPTQWQAVTKSVEFPRSLVEKTVAARGEVRRDS